MTQKELQEMMRQGNDGLLIAQLRLGRKTAEPKPEEYWTKIKPALHDVMDEKKRPNKWVKTDSSNLNPNDVTIQVSGNGDQNKVTKPEKVARVALAIQKLIVKRSVSFLFGNPVQLNCEIEDGTKQDEVLESVKKVLFHAKTGILNRQIARDVCSFTEAAELWYPVENKNKRYGFDSDFVLRAAQLSPANGDKLYPYFDESGDMIAFSREFVIKDHTNKNHTFFETYTAEEHRRWELANAGTWTLMEGFPKKNPIGKIPIIYAYQPEVEWEDVQNLIDRLEKLLSNFADTNDYHASPKIVTKGQINGWAQKGEAGAIIEMDEGGSAEYLSWAQAPEAVKLEIETLIRMIYTITQTPDISFDAVKGIGAVSGIALKLLFLDAHLKVQDKREIYDDFLQRRISVIKAFLEKMNLEDSAYVEACQSIVIEPEIIPYMLNDESTQVSTLLAATGNKQIMSRETAISSLGWVNDVKSELEKIQAEEDAIAADDITNPTVY